MGKTSSFSFSSYSSSFVVYFFLLEGAPNLFASLEETIVRFLAMPKHSIFSRYPGGQEPPIGSSISKKPRPLEGGNWVCESPYCRSVNHLGGTECYKCGVWRGAFSENKPGWESSFPYNKPMGMPPSGPSTVDSSAFRMGPVFEQRPVNDLSGNPSSLSVTSEGKRLAEQLVASFAASLNPIQDAAECLASATMWLHQMKAQMPNGDGFPSNYLPAPTRGVSVPLGMNGAGHALEQTHYNSARGWDTHRGPATYGHKPSGKSLGSPRPSLPPPNVRIEDYWDCPSDYLRKYGDPAATKTASTGVSVKPEVGTNGNWECDKCRNINFPRRTSCFQCKTKRGPEGENIVRNYVSRLIEEAGQRER